MIIGADSSCPGHHMVAQQHVGAGKRFRGTDIDEPEAPRKSGERAGWQPFEYIAFERDCVSRGDLIQQGRRKQINAGIHERTAAERYVLLDKSSDALLVVDQ